MGLGQGLGDDLGVGENRHEVRIPHPTGNDVQMQVTRDPSPGPLSQVDPQVVSMRSHDEVESGD